MPRLRTSPPEGYKKTTVSNNNDTISFQFGEPSTSGFSKSRCQDTVSINQEGNLTEFHGPRMTGISKSQNLSNQRDSDTSEEVLGSEALPRGIFFSKLLMFIKISVVQLIDLPLKKMKYLDNYKLDQI